MLLSNRCVIFIVRLHLARANGIMMYLVRVCRL